MRALGVDPGARRVGLALSDEDRILASPHATVAAAARDAETAARVAAVAREHGVTTIVVGLPLKLDGREGEAARRARRFATALARATGLEPVLWDERLTTLAAERALREGGVRGARQRKVVDQVAAALLLQSYLDAQRGSDGDHDIEY